MTWELIIGPKLPQEARKTLPPARKRTCLRHLLVVLARQVQEGRLLEALCPRRASIPHRAFLILPQEKIQICPPRLTALTLRIRT